MPANKVQLLTLSIAATADFNEYLAVSQAGTLAAAGAKMFGLATTNGEINVQLAVDVLGTSVAIAGAAIAKDADLEVGVNGKLVTQAAGITVARAVQAAAANGDQLEVLLLP